MILQTIIFISITQVILYLIADRLNLKYGKSIILLMIMFGHFFIFPQFFYPKMDHDDNGVCGLPFLAVNLGFWIIGGFIAVGTHVIYKITKSVLKPN